MKKLAPSDLDVKFKAEIMEVIKKYVSTMDNQNLLAILGHTVGVAVALQQGLDPYYAMDIVFINAEQGNKEAVELFSSKGAA